MKIPVTLCLEEGTLASLRALAKESGSSYSALADLFVRRGIEQVKPEGLRQWAETRSARPVPPGVPGATVPAGPRLTPSEQRVLDTVPAEGRIPTVSIMARAGCGYTIAVRALRRLTALQLITGDLLPGKELGGEDDRERRMCWWREGVKP